MALSKVNSSGADQSGILMVHVEFNLHRETDINPTRNTRTHSRRRKEKGETRQKTEEGVGWRINRDF
jgi:hypothetical protein